MTGLLEQPPTAAPEAPPSGTEPAPPAPPEVAAAGTCPTCGNPLRAEQDWCLECGSAQPGRLGTRPGWRAALTVVTLTAVLALGAVAAAYAALSSEATREAAAPAPPSAAPTVAQAPAVPAPQPDAAAPGTIPAPGADSKPPKVDVPEPRDTADPPSVPRGSAGSGSGATGGTDSNSDDEARDDDAAARPEPKPLALKAGDARTYDPLERGNGATGDPDDAIDGKAGTAWEAPVDADGNVRIGLALSLDAARALSAVEMRADTPGFTVEVYATRADRLPPDVLDARWEHIGDRRDVGVRERVKLGGKFKHVLLWVTVQPADSKVAIPEVEVFG